MYSEYDVVDERWLALFEENEENVSKIQDLNDSPVVKHGHSASY